MTQKTWTTAEIYINPGPHDTAEPYQSELFDAPARFTPAFIDAFRSETASAILSYPEIPAELEEAVSLGKRTCPACGGSGNATATSRGVDNGIILSASLSCPCRSLEAFWSHWDKIRLRWRNVSLATLEPSTVESPMDYDRQVRIINTIRANPGGSYLFYGKSSTDGSGLGKTHYAKCLYRQALTDWSNNPAWKNGLSVWDVSANQLVEAPASATADNPTVHITPTLIDKLARKGLKPCLFISEVSKFTVTEARMNRLADLVDTIWESKGQVVMTSQLSADELGTKWDSLPGAQYGEALVRRFAKGKDGNAFEFSREPLS